jgi:hypothetical protein
MLAIWLCLLFLAGVVPPICGLIAWRWWLNFNRDMLGRKIDTTDIANTAKVAESFFQSLNVPIRRRGALWRLAGSKEVKPPESLE